MNKLREVIEYVDIDTMLHVLCIQLGIIPEDSCFVTEAKGIYWTNNPLCNYLGDMLNGLCDQGMVLEEMGPDGESNQRYKWNPDYEDPVTWARKNKNTHQPIDTLAVLKDGAGVLEELLSSVSQSLSNNSCNEMDVNNTDENWRFLQAIENLCYNHEGDKTKKRPALKQKLVFNDWLVIDALKVLLKQLNEKG